MESKKHNDLVRELASLFGKQGFMVKAVDGVTVNQPNVVDNDGIGDRQNKIPDIDAFDERNKRVIRGEAKIGNGDIESEHSLTQYKLFSNRDNNGVPSWLYLIVPQGQKSYAESIISRNIDRQQLDNIGIVESSLY